MAEEKQYIGGVKLVERKFQDGGSVLNVSIMWSKVKEQLEALAAKNEKGYINLCISSRKSVGQYGDTHSLYVSQWKPKEQGATPTPTPTANDGAGRVHTGAAFVPSKQPVTDDLPF